MNIKKYLQNKINISVIIPTYNRGNSTLMKTIESAINQTYKPYEILICDDGSTDNTFDLIKSLNNPKIKYINCGRSGRPSIPRNIGIKKSKGNWIAFLDSDDYWMKNKLKNQVEIIKKKNCKIISSNAYLDKKNKLYFTSAILEIKKRDLLFTNNIINSSVLVRKDCLIKSKLFPESKFFKAIEDYLLWFKLSYVTNIFFLNEPLLIYNQNDYLRISPKKKLIQIVKSFFIHFYFLKIILIKKDFMSLKDLLFILLNKFKNFIFKNYLYNRSKSFHGFKEKVTVIMPVYNCENYVSSAIESILNQNYINFELIICNDNSDDRSLEIIKFYKLLSNKISYFSNKKRLGVSRSLNMLIKKANGNFIARMDADDISTKDRISYQIQKLKKEKVDLISNGISYFGNIKLFKIIFHRPILNSSQIKARLLFYNPINHPTILFKKSISNNFNFNLKDEGFEDWACWIKLIKTNIKMFCDKKIVLKYRIHQNNHSSLLSNKKDKIISQIISKVLDINLVSLDYTLKNQLYLKNYINLIKSNKNINFEKLEIDKISNYYSFSNNKLLYLLKGKSYKKLIFIVNLFYFRFLKREANF